jgi:hypothetical protein
MDTAWLIVGHRFEDEGWLPECDSNNKVWVSASQDVVMFCGKHTVSKRGTRACPLVRAPHLAATATGSVRAVSLVNGTPIASAASADIAQALSGAPLVGTTALLYLEDSLELLTGDDSGRVMVWSNYARSRTGVAGAEPRFVSAPLPRPDAKCPADDDIAVPPTPTVGVRVGELLGAPASEGPPGRSMSGRVSTSAEFVQRVRKPPQPAAGAGTSGAPRTSGAVRRLPQ